MKHLLEKILSVNSIVISTHRESDGDGLGSQMGLFYALKKLGKNVRALNVDAVPTKYSFLDPENVIDNFEGDFSPLESTDLALIMDTNDSRYLEPLYKEFEKKCEEIVFIDHHPILKSGPQPTDGSLIDISAASTGEMTFNIIKALNVELDENIARSIYTSIAFDTQVFRYVRNSPASHLIAAELLNFGIDPEGIHKRLFGSQTIQKIAFLSNVLGNVEYFSGGRLAFLMIRDKDLINHGLDTDATRDVIDMLMNVESIEVAVLFREDSHNCFKASFRSKGNIEVLTAAENLGGGGHRYAAGAYLEGQLEPFKAKIVDDFLPRLSKR